MRTCTDCGGAIPPQTGAGRPRSRCLDCAPSRSKVVTLVKKTSAQPAATADVPPPLADASRYPLVDAVRKTLADAGRLDTVEGQAALVLAAAMLNPLASASGAASAAREMRATLAAALAGTKQADGVDDLAERRRAVGGQ